jgi:hypothetical protein
MTFRTRRKIEIKNDELNIKLASERSCFIFLMFQDLFLALDQVVLLRFVDSISPSGQESEGHIYNKPLPLHSTHTIVFPLPKLTMCKSKYLSYIANVPYLHSHTLNLNEICCVLIIKLPRLSSFIYWTGMPFSFIKFYKIHGRRLTLKKKSMSKRRYVYFF